MTEIGPRIYQAWKDDLPLTAKGLAAALAYVDVQAEAIRGQLQTFDGDIRRLQARLIDRVESKH